MLRIYSECDTVKVDTCENHCQTYTVKPMDEFESKASTNGWASGLQASTSYMARVIAVNDFGKGTLSSAVYFQTPSKSLQAHPEYAKI